MRARPACSFALALAAVTGCAAGEPIGDGPQALELADAGPAVVGLVYVDVADAAGRPLLADAVYVASDYQEPSAAGCFEAQTSYACETWRADFEANDEVNVLAEVCGESFLGTLAVDDMAVGYEDGVRSAHVTVVADLAPCGTATPRPSDDTISG
jgi:hypothetical protein